MGESDDEEELEDDELLEEELLLELDEEDELDELLDDAAGVVTLIDEVLALTLPAAS